MRVAWRRIEGPVACIVLSVTSRTRRSTFGLWLEGGGPFLAHGLQTVWKAFSAMTCGATLVGTTSETAAVTDVVSQAPDKLSFVSGSEAASSLA
jgi:hypothetical protein